MIIPATFNAFSSGGSRTRNGMSPAGFVRTSLTPASAMSVIRQSGTHVGGPSSSERGIAEMRMSKLAELFRSVECSITALVVSLWICSTDLVLSIGTSDSWG